MRSIEEWLPDDDFVRIHRSVLVSSKHITSINGRQVKVESVTLPIGDSYRDRLLAYLEAKGQIPFGNNGRL